MIRDFFDGITAYFRRMPNFSKLGLWKFAFIPSIMGLLFFGVVLFSAINFGDDLGSAMTSWYKWSWGAAFVATLANWIGGILMVVIGLLISKYVVMILAAPFMGPMSTKIETNKFPQKVVHQNANSGATGFIRGLRITFRNLFREIFFTLLLLIVGFVLPFLSPFTTIGIFLLQSYYAGYGNMDVTLERFYGVKESSRFVRRHAGLAMGNGIVFMFLLMIGIGFLIAPPLATNAVTEDVLKRIQ